MSADDLPDEVYREVLTTLREADVEQHTYERVARWLDLWTDDTIRLRKRLREADACVAELQKAMFRNVGGER